jgi:hypothetical protein
MLKLKVIHSEIAGFNDEELAIEIRRLKLPYFVPKECVIKRSDPDHLYDRQWGI